MKSGCVNINSSLFSFQDPAGIFELIEVVGNGTYGQVYKVCWQNEIDLYISGTKEL